MDLDLARAVAERSGAAAERFDDNGRFVALQTVGVARMGRARDFRIERLGVKRHDYRRAFGHKRANTARVVEMMMGRDGVTDGLAGEPLLDRLDHGRGAGLVQRPFDGDQMIAHLDQDRRMGAALNLVHAGRELEPFDYRLAAHILIADVARDAAQNPLGCDRRGVGFFAPDGLRDGEDIAGERRVVADRFNLLLLQRSAVQFVAQIKRQHNAVDFAPVTVAQRIAAVAFERIVFENFGLRR